VRDDEMERVHEVVAHRRAAESIPRDAPDLVGGRRLAEVASPLHGALGRAVPHDRQRRQRHHRLRVPAVRGATAR
jgi:hypothetical protein